MQLSLASLYSGVLAGAIDYYIIAKLQNLRSDAVYVKVCDSSGQGPGVNSNCVSLLPGLPC